MTNLQNDVHEFHVAFRHPAPEQPVLELTPEVTALLLARVKWLKEEARELKTALKAGDLVGVIDALGDSIYFGVGGYVVLGLPLDPFWDNIQEANMAKLDADGEPIYGPGGKIQKPEGWVPPEDRHEEVLAELGWRPARTAQVPGTLL